MKAVAIHRHGGAEELELIDIALPAPAPHEVRIRHTAIGMNFSDVNLRSGGFYVTGPNSFPLILGNEAAGVVEEVGSKVTAFRPGDRVGYVGTGGLFFENTGAYAEQRNISERCLVRVPDDISDEQVAAVLLKGMTASVIMHRCYRPQVGDHVLIHAAASGVGSLLAQWCRSAGVKVIGTVGSREKAEFARAHGCDETILYREEEFVPAVRRIVPEGVAAVMDGVGKDTFLPSLDCIRPFGSMINYGNASGPTPAFPLILLAQKGCLVLHRPGFGWHANTFETRQAACDELFGMIRSGALRVEICATFPLAEAAAAHRLAESGGAAGSIVIKP